MHSTADEVYAEERFAFRRALYGIPALSRDSVSGFQRVSTSDSTKGNRDNQQQSRSAIRELAKTNGIMASNFYTLIGMLGSIPRDAGYTWEGGELEAHITLIWATGERVLVPLDLWNSFEVKFLFSLSVDIADNC